MLLRIDPVQRWLVANARAVAVVAVGAALLTTVLWPGGGLIDMQVYRAGAQTWLHGGPLYSRGVLGPMFFTYPPFAAVFFTPLALVPLPVLCVLWMAGNLALLWLIVRRCQQAVGLPPELALVFAGVAVWLEPVRTSLMLGQINIVLLGLVVCDLCRSRPSRWTGVGVGLAAAVKLTPLIFVVHLLLARRWREAGTALATFAATVVVGLLLAPEAALYWRGGVFADSTRVGPVLNWSNQSLHGLLARALGEAGSTGPWLLAGAAVGLAGTLLAAVVDRRGDRVLAVGLTGMTACAVSPFSWEHHWVWFVPVVIALAARGLSWWIPGLVFLAGAAIPTGLPPLDFGHGIPTGLVSADVLGGVAAFLVRNIYVWTLVALLSGFGMRYGRKRLAGSHRSAERAQPA
jgi:alpha-1,2-mannosyltransferase